MNLIYLYVFRMSVGVRATCQPSLLSSEACHSTTPATLGMPCCSSLVCVCSSVLLSHPRPAPFLLLHCSLWLPRASLCPEHCLEVVRFSYVLRVCLCVAQTLACGSHGVCRLSLAGSGNNTEVVQACDCFVGYLSPYVGRLQGRLLSPT